MFTPSVEISQNLFFDEFYWCPFRRNGNREARDRVNPPENRALIYTKKAGDLFAAHQFWKVVHFHHLEKSWRRGKYGKPAASHEMKIKANRKTLHIYFTDRCPTCANTCFIVEYDVFVIGKRLFRHIHTKQKGVSALLLQSVNFHLFP